MFKQIDWQMIAFVGLSLLNDYWTNYHLPRIYYWDVNDKNNPFKKSA